MDPVTALIFAVWVAGYFTRNVTEDLVFKARGEDPPSYRRQQQRWERQKERRDRGPGPARKFAGNAWADAWAQADERRARRVEKTAQRRRDAATEKDMAAAEDEAYELNERLNAAAGTTEPAQVFDPVPPAPAPGPPRPKPSCFYCGRERDLGELPFVQDGWRKVRACRACRPQDTAQKPQPVPAAPSAPAPEAPSPDGTAAPAADPASSNPAPEPTTDRDAEIIQFADWQQRPAAEPTSKEKNMSAEITGLRSAIAFANGSASAADAAATQVELAIAGLHAGGTTGDSITALQAAMEGHHTTAAHYRSAAVTLENQLQIAEAYEANKGAGTREFVTSD